MALKKEAGAGEKTMYDMRLSLKNLFPKNRKSCYDIFLLNKKPNKIKFQRVTSLQHNFIFINEQQIRYVQFITKNS